jgi:glycosyltransferase involved in cell wall biosynthesis
MVATQIQRMPQFRQVAISYWPHLRADGQDVERRRRAVPTGGGSGAEATTARATDHRHLILVNERHIGPWQRACLTLPERFRQRMFHGVGTRQHLTYMWQVLRWLPALKPRVIVCYDGYKLGPQLRSVITWPCRVVLSQHGLSYFLDTADALRVYSLKSFDVIWTLTEAAYRFDRRRATAYETPVRVLPNYVDVDTFRPVSDSERQALRREWQLPPGATVVLMLGRLVPKKGAHVLLTAWSKVLREVGDAYLWVVGGGDKAYLDYLRNLCAVQGMERHVRWQGPVAPDRVSTCYQAADLYVLPTLCTEGLSLSLLEAMACGIPCVVSDHDAAREVRHGDDVQLVPDPNIDGAFVAPVVNLLKNRERARQMGEAARATVVKYYSPDTAFTSISEFYAEQLSLAGARP